MFAGCLAVLLFGKEGVGVLVRQYFRSSVGAGSLPPLRNFLCLYPLGLRAVVWCCCRPPAPPSCRPRERALEFWFCTSFSVQFLLAFPVSFSRPAGFISLSCCDPPTQFAAGWQGPNSIAGLGRFLKGLMSFTFFVYTCMSALANESMIRLLLSGLASCPTYNRLGRHPFCCPRHGQSIKQVVYLVTGERWAMYHLTCC